jgi:hypothetical protein
MAMNGMSMMPPNGGGGGGDGDRPKRPSGLGHPAVSIPDEKGQSAVVAQPMPVVLTVGTIIKLASVIMVPLLGILSAGIYHYHKTNAHIEDPVIHLTRGERSKLENKSEAKAERKKLEKSITREVKLQARELKQDLATEQKVQIKKLGTELKLEQKAWGDRLLQEVKKARRDIRNQ